MAIKFGTDGWRAIIADDYTFENLGNVSQATAQWIGEAKELKNAVVIGYDARFEGQTFAKHAASVFAASGIEVQLADTISPTPAVSLACEKNDIVGVVITASHNPHRYNGFKIKAPFGGPATPDQIDQVEAYLPNVEVPSLQPYEVYAEEGTIEEVQITEQYLNTVREKIDLDSIRDHGIKVAHDPMYGASQGLLKKLLGEGNVCEIHGTFNPGFDGQAPEPIEKNLGELFTVITENNCAVGIANDGDADRVGMFDENGDFVDSHKLLSLLVKYLSQQKGMDGSVIKTFSTTTMLDKQAEKYDLAIETTPIGFKYIADKMANNDVLVGGEESGGIAVKGHIPERDGLFIGLTITEMVVQSGKSLSTLVDELHDEFGLHSFYRDDLHTPQERKETFIEECKNKNITEIAGKKVTDWQFTDGIKHILDDDSWLLVRPSGTEPVLRVYAEAETKQEAKALVEDVVKLVNK